MQIAIDYGEIDAGLTAIVSAGAALADPRAMQAFTGYLGRTGNAMFNARADGVGPAIQHMYEWGQISNPAGRLWLMVWTPTAGGTSGQVTFLPSKLFKPKEDWQRSREAQEGIRFGEKRWPEKARELETKASFTWRAGASRASPKDIKPGANKRGEAIAKPTYLVNFVGGNTRFSKSMTVGNEYRGRFNALFHQFWGGEFPKRIKGVSGRVEKEYATMIEREIHKEIAMARMKSRAPIPAMNQVITITSGRLPSTRRTITVSPRVVNSLVERMVKRWQKS